MGADCASAILASPWSSGEFQGCSLPRKHCNILVACTTVAHPRLVAAREEHLCCEKRLRLVAFGGAYGSPAHASLGVVRPPKLKLQLQLDYRFCSVLFASTSLAPLHLEQATRGTFKRLHFFRRPRLRHAFSVIELVVRSVEMNFICEALGTGPAKTGGVRAHRRWSW